MSISRRQFFRGLVGQSDDRQRQHEKRLFAVESYVRTNLLPYDFSLTPEQTGEALDAAVAGVDLDGEGEILGAERRAKLHQIVESMVDRWREEYLQAEGTRRDAMGVVEEFFSFEAKSDDLDKLERRFHTTDTESLRELVERRVRIHLSELPNARLANCSSTELRDLVFSEIRSWC